MTKSAICSETFACLSSTILSCQILSKMRAVVYESPFRVTVQDVPKPTIEHADDVIVKGAPRLISVNGVLTYLFSNY